MDDDLAFQETGIREFLSLSASGLGPDEAISRLSTQRGIINLRRRGRLIGTITRVLDTGQLPDDLQEQLDEVLEQLHSSHPPEDPRESAEADVPVVAEEKTSRAVVSPDKDSTIQALALGSTPGVEGL